MKRGQISFEHMFVLMLAIMIIIPGTMLFYQFSKSSNQQVVSTQVDRIGNEVIKNAEILYFLGDGSRIKISLQIPRPVSNISIDDEEIVIDYLSYNGKNSAVFFPSVPIQAKYPMGDPLGEYYSINPDGFHSGFIYLVMENQNGVIVVWEEGT